MSPEPQMPDIEFIEADIPQPVIRMGTCSGCGYKFVIGVQGTVRRHRRHGRLCSGSQSPPVETDTPSTAAIERWADDHFTQGEVAVVMRLVEEFGWRPPSGLGD